jgi:hypothetical protein
MSYKRKKNNVLEGLTRPIPLSPKQITEMISRVELIEIKNK